MRKVYGALVIILCILSIAEARADEFTTKEGYDPLNPVIVRIALELKGNDELQSGENVWNWMNENIRYEMHVGGIGDVKKTIDVGAGECASQATLAASLLIACDISPLRVRIGSGNRDNEPGHSWVEIFTDKWHRFDTCFYHDFCTELSCPLYKEGKEFNEIDYYYYDQTPFNLILVETEILRGAGTNQDSIVLKIRNDGDLKCSHPPIGINSASPVQYSRHLSSIVIEPSETVSYKFQVNGDGIAGNIQITIGNIVFEMYSELEL